MLDRYAYQWDYLKSEEGRDDLLSLINQYTQWKKYAHSNFFKKFGNISYSISKYLTEWNCASGEIYKRMRSLCEKALRDRKITAWLMANDFAATLALFPALWGVRLLRQGKAKTATTKSAGSIWRRQWKASSCR